MPQGGKLNYKDKQKPQSDHIETGCEKKEFSVKTARGRALATAIALRLGSAH
jgi:hypothetical protein